MADLLQQSMQADGLSKFYRWQAVCNGLSVNLAFRPLEQFGAPLGVQTGLAVQPRVAGRRHLAILHLLSDMPPALARAPGVVVRPFGKVQAGARGPDVARDAPGKGRNVAVPGPFGFERVTVVAGILQERDDGRGRRVAGQEVVSARDGGILARQIGKLQNDDGEEAERAHPFEPLFHGSILTYECEKQDRFSFGRA